MNEISLSLSHGRREEEETSENCRSCYSTEQMRGWRKKKLCGKLCKADVVPTPSWMSTRVLRQRAATQWRVLMWCCYDVERRMVCGEKQGLNGHNSRAICYELEILCVHSREKWTRTPIDWIWRFAIGESNWASNCDWLLADFSFLFFSNSHSESSAIKNHRSYENWKKKRKVSFFRIFRRVISINESSSHHVRNPGGKICNGNLHFVLKAQLTFTLVQASSWAFTFRIFRTFSAPLRVIERKATCWKCVYIFSVIAVGESNRRKSEKEKKNHRHGRELTIFSTHCI